MKEDVVVRGLGLKGERRASEGVDAGPYGVARAEVEVAAVSPPPGAPIVDRLPERRLEVARADVHRLKVGGVDVRDVVSEELLPTRRKADRCLQGGHGVGGGEFADEHAARTA